MGGYAEYGYDKGEGKVIRAKPKAILFRENKGEEYWVPQSQIHENSEVWKEGDEGMIVVSAWFAKTKGWIDEY